MKQKLLWVVLALATAMQATVLRAEVTFPPALTPAVQEAKAARLAAELLTRFHYKAMPLDDNLSSKMFDQYLKALDPEKLYFLQADVDRLGADRTRRGWWPCWQCPRRGRRWSCWNCAGSGRRGWSRASS